MNDDESIMGEPITCDEVPERGSEAGEIYARQLLNRATLACRFDPSLRCTDPECEDCRRGA